MGALEDFTTYTENEPVSDRFSCATRKCTFTDLYNSDYNHYVYKDKGINFFGDYFRHTFEMHYDSMDNGVVGVTWMVSNTLEDLNDQRTTNDYIAVMFYKNGSGSPFVYYEANGSPGSYALNSLSTVYITIVRRGATVTINIYSDKQCTNLLKTQALTCSSTGFRYIYCAATYGVTGGPKITGYISDLVLYTGCPLIQLITDTYTTFLGMPISMSYNDGRELKVFNFWSAADIKTRDVGKNIENIVLDGLEVGNGISDCYESMTSVDWMTDAGEKLTVSGTGLDALDTTWYIESFGYAVEAGVPNVCRWCLTLEKAY